MGTVRRKFFSGFNGALIFLAYVFQRRQQFIVERMQAAVFLLQMQNEVVAHYHGFLFASGFIVFCFHCGLDHSKIAVSFEGKQAFEFGGHRLSAHCGLRRSYWNDSFVRIIWRVWRLPAFGHWSEVLFDAG